MKLLANKLTLEAKDILNQSGIEVIENISTSNNLIEIIEEHHIEGIVFDNNNDFNADLIEACPSIKLIAFKTELEDTSDIIFAKNQGVHVVSIDNATAIAKAELAFAHLLGMVRFLHQSNREMPLEGDINFEILHNSLIGQEVRGKKIGIIGMNNTGAELARIAIGLGMYPLITDHQPKNIIIPIEYFDGQTLEFTIEHTDFNKILSNVDFLIINTNTENGYILDSEQFSKINNGIAIINLEQGAINEVELINNINSGKVMYAALDAFEKQPNPEVQLLMTPELSLSPNLASETYETHLRISKELAETIADILV